MTPNMNKSLSDIFDIELTQTDKSVDELKFEAKAESIDSLETQRVYVKNNLVKLIEKGSTALDKMISIAESTEVGKDFSVVSEMIKTLVATNMTLLESEVVHKIKDIQPVQPGQITTNNTVFVGSTSELSKYLKENSGPVPSIQIIENKH